MLGIVCYCAILGLLIILMLKRPCYAYAAFFCMFGLEQWGDIYVPLLRQISFLSNIFILIPLWVTCILRLNKIATTGLWSPTSQKILILILYGYAAISLLWTPDDVDKWMKWYTSLPYILTGIFILPFCFHRTEDILKAQKFFIYIGCILLLLLAFVPNWGARAIMIEGNHDKVGLPLALAELAGYVLIASSLNLKKSYLPWVVFFLSLIAGLTVAIRSGSRGPVIFSILTILLIAPIAWKGDFIKRYLGVASLGAILAVAVIEIFAASSAFTDRWQSTSMMKDSESRINAGLTLLSHAYNDPLSIIFGLGNSAAFSVTELQMYPHMVPMEVLAEEGLIGGMVWLAIIVNAIKQIKFIRSRFLNHPDLKRTFLVFFGSFIFSTLLSFKQGSLISFSTPFVFIAMQERFIAIRKHGK